MAVDLQHSTVRIADPTQRPERVKLLIRQRLPRTTVWLSVTRGMPETGPVPGGHGAPMPLRPGCGG